MKSSKSTENSCNSIVFIFNAYIDITLRDWLFTYLFIFLLQWLCVSDVPDSKFYYPAGTG